jgi:hypothetical protein
MGPLRDAVMPLAARVPYARRQMLASLSGAKAGPFRTLPAPDDAGRAPL